MREDVIRAVETYLNDLGTKDLSYAPFHADNTFERPLRPPINVAAALRQFLTGLFPAINGIHFVRHIVEASGVLPSSTSIQLSA